MRGLERSGNHASAATSASSWALVRVHAAIAGRRQPGFRPARGGGERLRAGGGGGAVAAGLIGGALIGGLIAAAATSPYYGYGYPAYYGYPG